MFRRRRLPPELEVPFAAFHILLHDLEPAKAALTEVMPTTRSPGRPFPDALHDYEQGLARVAVLMPAWRAAPVEAEWTACERGLAEARKLARGLREEAPDLGGFEGLIWAVERLLAPLEAFVAANERFRRLGGR